MYDISFIVCRAQTKKLAHAKQSINQSTIYTIEFYTIVIINISTNVADEKSLPVSHIDKVSPEFVLVYSKYEHAKLLLIPGMYRFVYIPFPVRYRI